jgi:hypothetical protein
MTSIPEWSRSALPYILNQDFFERGVRPSGNGIRESGRQTLSQEKGWL